MLSGAANYAMYTYIHTYLATYLHIFGEENQILLVADIDTAYGHIFSQQLPTQSSVRDA